MKFNGYIMSGNPEKYGKLAKPKPEAAKVFPAPALRDMTDKTFASLLGMNQFIGGGE